jgi:hypothetical protein
MSNGGRNELIGCKAAYSDYLQQAHAMCVAVMVFPVISWSQMCRATMQNHLCTSQWPVIQWYNGSALVILWDPRKCLCASIRRAWLLAGDTYDSYLELEMSAMAVLML